MKKLFILLCAGSLICAMAGLAFADVDVYTDVDKDVDVTETIEQTITKDVDLDIDQAVTVDTSAQADVTKNDALAGNIVVEWGANGAALLDNNAFRYATGIISVNQAPGNANNQGNAVALAYDCGPDDCSSAFLSAATHTEMENGTSDVNLDPGLISAIVQTFINPNFPNNIGGSNIVVSLGTSIRRDTIRANAFQRVTGVTSVNQSAGNCNNQDNAVAIAVGEEPTAALAEADLGQTVANAITFEAGITKTDRILDSAFQNAQGITSVNQSSGACNNQGNSVAIVVTGLNQIF